MYTQQQWRNATIPCLKAINQHHENGVNPTIWVPQEIKVQPVIWVPRWLVCSALIWVPQGINEQPRDLGAPVSGVQARDLGVPGNQHATPWSGCPTELMCNPVTWESLWISVQPGCLVSYVCVPVSSMLAVL